MCDPRKLLTIPEAAEMLKLNPEVLRRWLRNGKLPGIKLGHDWRIAESSLESVLKPSEGNATTTAEQGPKMCFKFPKWLEFSGLPKHLNTLYGPMCWPVFKKIIELDFEQGEKEDRKIHVSLENLEIRMGYPKDQLLATFKDLEAEGLLLLEPKRTIPEWVKVKTPVKTPLSILDIHFSEGGVKGAPEKAFESRCLRRYLS